MTFLGQKITVFPGDVSVNFGHSLKTQKTTSFLSQRRPNVPKIYQIFKPNVIGVSTNASRFLYVFEFRPGFCSYFPAKCPLLCVREF